ncbi:MAG: DUF2202 domain-containing protein [Ferruginibacter sp.]
MKYLLRKSGFAVISFTILLTAFSCNKNDTAGNSNANGNANGNPNIENLRTGINNLPAEQLNQAELASLAYMREEEKLARDVYTALYTKWRANIFNNISKSEQTHMDAVLLLLNKYGLEDPAANKPAGVFTNPELQGLYNSLLLQGNSSLLNAYITGLTIEDLDIYDLENALVDIDNQDILLVYTNLRKGSRNHMRSFYRNLTNAGGSYTPQYITQAAFDAIRNSGMETGF